ncbi:hypothetical protein GUJ93_ZPchr0008g13037 [Zizania palustris]|uniref:BZIP domain-containing protein n=1 Tax=Zizania palustris TaxID=103762 RepID=A0A8J5VKL7_ZIZPA|nr:hypothetical protein GUJ93_ZPchr0008g13037 [Zizania palustris]
MDGSSDQDFFAAATFEEIMDNLSPIPEENGEDAGVVGNDNSSAPPRPLLRELAAPVPPVEGGMSRTPDFPGNSSFGQGWSLSDIIGVRPAAHGLDFAVQGDGDMPPSLDEENEEDLFSMFVNFGKVNSAGVGSSTSTHQRSHFMDASSSMAGAGALPPRAPRHQRSHSMDASSSMAGAGALPPRAPRHQRSHSMDASSSMAGAGALPPRAPRHQRSHSMDASSSMAGAGALPPRAPTHQRSHSMDAASSMAGAGALPPRAPTHQRSHSMDAASSMAGAGALPPRAPRHQRSHSMDASSSMVGAGALPPRAPRHQRSHSMDVPSCSLQAHQHGSPAAAGIGNSERKQISEAELAQLAVVNPKRARRIVSNRQSAARAKERKIQYTAALEQKVKDLEEELASLTARLAHFKRRNNLLQAENNQLKMNVQNVEINDQLKSALNDILASEIKNLRIEPAKIGSGGVAMNLGGGDQQMLDNHTIMQQMVDESQAMQQMLDENQALMQQMLGQNQSAVNMQMMQVPPPPSLPELPQSESLDQQLQQMMDAGFNHGQMCDDGSQNNGN